MNKNKITTAIFSLALQISILLIPIQTSAVGGDFDAGNFIRNPISYNNFGEIIKAIAQFLAKIAFPLAAAMIILTGIRFLMARGNPEKVNRAKETFKWAILGTAIVIGAYAIVLSIERIFEESF